MRDRLWIVIVVAALALELGTYFVNPLNVPSNDPRLRLWGVTIFRQTSRSMEPTIPANGIFFVSAWGYWHSGPKVGDIVVFRYTLDRSIEYAKRVIAVGGSEVQIADGVVFVDGRKVAESYLAHQQFADDYSRTFARTKVPAGTYFVLGDNRSNSADSRVWGFLPRADVIGRAHVAFNSQ
jgi:signal peptidase I